MSTSNYRIQEGFNLYATAPEYMTAEKFQATGWETDKYFEGCESLQEKVEMYNDDQYYFWINETVGDIKEALEKVNQVLEFHKITLRSGYYAGCQLYVEEDDRYWYFDPSDPDDIYKYNFDLLKTKLFMAAVAKKYGMDQLTVAARFSSGETWYSKVN